MPDVSQYLEIQVEPLKSGSATLEKLEFGCVVSGCHPGNLSDDQSKYIEELLYKHGVVVWKNIDLTPQQQYRLHHAIDPNAKSYGHSKIGRPDTKPGEIRIERDIPEQPEVHLIGHGFVDDPEILRGVPPLTLAHPTHHTFHKEVISQEDTDQGYSRFFRFHMDAALYDKEPPIMTSLYGVSIPTGCTTIRYDDGSGDEIADAPLGGTAFASGRLMFELLSPEMKSVAVRSRVRYAPYSYNWISTAKSRSNGLGMISEGKEVSLEDLPPWEEEKVKMFPVVWRNPKDGALHLQVNPSNIQAVFIDPIPAASRREESLYPDGASLTDLEKARDLIYLLQRPAIAPENLMIYDWSERDFVCFHNRGVMHSVTGTYPKTLSKPRVLYQCNLAASFTVSGPTAEDVIKFA